MAPNRGNKPAHGLRIVSQMWPVRASGLCRLTVMLMLIVCSLPPNTHQATINIAWLATGPFVYYFNASTSLGALVHSTDVIQSDPTVLSGDTFDVKWKDSSCSKKMAVGAIFEYFDIPTWSPDLILGPICSGAMEPVAQLAAYRNIPVFGWISSDPNINDKNIYNTLVRLLWPISNMGEGVVILMRKLGWKRVFLISGEGGDYGGLGLGIGNIIKGYETEGFEVARWERNVPHDITADAITAIYDKVKDEARIVILSVPMTKLRDWALALYDNNMHTGEYVIIYTDQQTATPELVDDITKVDFYKGTDGRDEDARKAYENFFLMFAKTLALSETQKFLSDYNTAAATSVKTWLPLPNVPPKPADFYSLFLYDAMLLYARAATEAGSVNDGRKIFAKVAGTFTKGGATGDIIMTDECDRIPDYWIYDLTSDGIFGASASTKTVKNGTGVQRSMEIHDDFRWGDGTVGLANAPLDVPECGFQNEKCQIVAIVVPVVLILVLTVVIIVAVLVHRKLKAERDLNNLVWKLNYDEMNIYTGAKGPGSQMNLRSGSQMLKKSRASVADSLAGQQLFITVANYRGTTVAIKKVNKSKIKMDRALLLEMRCMMESKHHNLNTFIGTCTEPPNVCVVWEYCSKGSLQDIIWNDTTSLDDMFKFSICIDITKGLCYLHESSIRLHGHLKSSNAVIDGRWTCKLSDFGAETFAQDQEEDEEISDHAKFSRLFWTSPETLRDGRETMDELGEFVRCNTSAGDIYSLGVILKEIFCRNGPYTEHEDQFDPKMTIDKVWHCESPEPFRPDLSELGSAIESDKEVADQLKAFIARCWTEDPLERPSANSTLKSLVKINPFKKANVMDNMIAMMEKHSQKLEEIVSERTVELEAEKKKTEQLLYKMLPKTVADDLAHGRNVDAESFECVSMYFSDIPGFSELAAASTPFEVVDILNGVYTLMDGTIERHDVYKVETVGDVYVLVSGLPIRNGDRHIVEIVNCALDILSGMLSFKVPHKPSYKLSIRIGCHTGAIVTGVVGLTNPRYCLFGDTINTTSRMESTSKPLRIHISPMAYKALSKFAGYRLADRGLIPVKGKGNMNTYWVLGRDGFNEPLPDFDKAFKSDDQPPTRLPVTVGKITNPKVLRPSAESGFSELESFDDPDSRKVSNISGTGRKLSTISARTAEGLTSVEMTEKPSAPTT